MNKFKQFVPDVDLVMWAVKPDKSIKTGNPILASTTWPPGGTIIKFFAQSFSMFTDMYISYL